MNIVKVKKKKNKLNEEVFGSGILGVGYDNTLSAASYTVQGKNPGYTYQMLPLSTDLQQKPNEVDNRTYIHPGSWVRGVGVNNPDKHFSGVVSRIVRNGDGSVACLYIKTFSTNRMVSILADENLTLIVNKDDMDAGINTFIPSENIYV